MKVFVFATVLAALVCIALAEEHHETETANTKVETDTETADAELTRAKKNAYHAAPAPAYHHAAPEYHHQEVHAGPAKAYTYPSPAPKVKCPSSLLLSCQPNVAHVPCVSPPAHHGYGYAPAPAHHGYGY